MYIVTLYSVTLLNFLEKNFSNQFYMDKAPFESLSRSTNKFFFSSSAVSRLDDNVLKHYCNEELFHMDITRTDSDGLYDVTFVELDLS